MPRSPKAGKLRPAVKSPRFLATMRAATSGMKRVDNAKLRYLRLRRQIAERERILLEHFSSSTALKTYVEQHRQSDVVRKKIRAAVMAKTRGRAREGALRELQKDSVYIAAYQALVAQSAVLVNDIFAEVPPLPSYCELLWFGERFEEELAGSEKRTDEQELLLEALESQWKARKEFLRSRWRDIVGSEFDISNPPRFQDLWPRKAPVPLRPFWSWAMNGAEARRMGHRQALVPQGGDGNDRGPPDGEGPSDSDEATVPAEPVDDQDREEIGCDFPELLAMAGGRELRQPGPEDARYTFPGTLYRRGEEVFYDYALVIPVPECGPCAQEIEGITPRSLTAAKVLVGKASVVIASLRDAGLADVFGRYGSPPRRALEDIEDVLAGVLSLKGPALYPSTDPPSEIRAIIRRLRESAALLRLIARTEMFLIHAGTNPLEYFTSLDVAVNNFPNYALKSTILPTTDPPMAPYNTLYFPETNKSYTYTDPQGGNAATRGNKFNNNMNVPNAFPPGPVHGWNVGQTWRSEEEERFDLRNYVRYLGDNSRDLQNPKLSGFYALLDDLVKSARGMRDAVAQFSGTYVDFRSDFERLASGIVHDAALSLSELLDGIANQLSLPKATLQEGSKRLALAVIFRQRWHPEGYVMGKLVGYKTLLPNQQETVRRRTFVKTTRELSTVQEFVATRQEDFSHSLKETREVVTEGSQKFNFAASASGDFDFLITSGDYTLESSYELSHLSRATQNMVAESILKTSSTFNEKREVKIRELAELEDLQEVTSQVQNTNQEITANYYYYQLLRQYRVTVELSDLRPVLLRTREIPSPAEIDDTFVSKHAHVLIHQLPLQLSVDAQETADRLRSLAKTFLRRRADMLQKAAELEVFRKEGVAPAASAEELGRWREEYRSKERTLAEARQAFIAAEEAYERARARMERVLAHLRENICYYMQFIWQSSPKVDHNKLLQDETFCLEPLPTVTRGLIRQGYFGNEEIFDYTGRSMALLDLILERLVPGSELLSSLSEEELRQTTLYQYLEAYYPETAAELLARIEQLAFVSDPAPEETALNARTVQIAQDALIVEAMPGQVPLLEGFQMAHRMLDVQKACLENAHMAARIKDRPWRDHGEDTYAVRRYDGSVPPSREVKETQSAK